MDATPAAVTLATIIADVGTMFTAAIGWVGTVASTIASQPILLVACVCMPLAGYGIGMFKRLLGAKA